MSANVETMFYVREKPWHGLGTEVQEAPNSEDALIWAGLDWLVEQKDVFTVTGDQIPGYKVNLRDKDGAPLGIVSDRYKVVQNQDAFQFTDDLLGEGVTYETAGALQGGRKVWLLARMPHRYIIAGDEIAPYPFMLANLDGTCEHPDYGTCIFEAKTASAYKAGEWDDAIPDEYQLQIQHYMAVTGYKAAYIAVLIGGNTFRWKLVERDEELISMLVELEADFWNHVQMNTPPAMDGSAASARFLAERFPDSVPKSQIVLPDTAADLIQQYDAACEQLEAITEQKQKAENRLKELLGENEVGTTGGRIITWKSVTQERLDSRTLKAEHPALYQKYINKTSYRRFSIKAAS